MNKSSFSCCPVKEDVSVGSSVLQLVVTDPDGPGLDYYITSGDSSGHFAIRSTGQMFLTKTLDREVSDRYELAVVVTDSKYVVQTSVLVDVLDVNGEYYDTMSW